VCLMPRQLLKELALLAQAEGATLYSALLAVYMALLSRYTSQSDILVGSPLACRNKLGFRNVVGDFVNTVVMRGMSR
jgi:non-ribosomal peptide synthetase component F